MIKMGNIWDLKANGSKVTNLIIDDNWQSLVSRFPLSFNRVSSSVQG